MDTEAVGCAIQRRDFIGSRALMPMNYRLIYSTPVCTKTVLYLVLVAEDSA